MEDNEPANGREDNGAKHRDPVTNVWGAISSIFTDVCVMISVLGVLAFFAYLVKG